jgi:DNA-damage-inducible protein D
MVDGVEIWYAREIQEILGYNKWDNFKKVIDKSIESCKNAQINEFDHFAGVGKMIDLGKGAIREVDDVMLTRYACYLIAMEADSRKPEIAFAKSYFATQTRKFELVEQRFLELDRLLKREKLSSSEKELSRVIYEVGIDGMGMARIRSRGDNAFFSMPTLEMKKKLGVKETRPLGDFIHPLAISAKEFSSAITAYNVNQNNLATEKDITIEHVKNNTNAREVLLRSGIKPEELPIQDDIKKVERKVNSEKKKLAKGTQKLNPILLNNRPVK